MVRSSTLKRIAKWAFFVPVTVVAIGLLLTYIMPGCSPQMYGVGKCMVGSVDLALPIMLAVLGGIYVAAAAIAFLVAPLLLLAWWMDFMRNDDAA